MLRTLLKITKRHGAAVALFAFLTIGGIFPCFFGCHKQDTLAANSYDHQEIALIGFGVDCSHGDVHYVAGDCGDDCCMAGHHTMLPAVAVTADPVYFDSGLVADSQYRHTDGLTPLTVERPPRA